MTPAVFVGVALAGGLGATLRFWLDGLVTARVGPRRPWGIWLVNVTGSLALGVVVGLAGRGLDPGWASILGTGLLGGYTTFSTAMWDATRLDRTGHRGAALGHTLSMLAAGVAAAALGYALGNG